MNPEHAHTAVKHVGLTCAQVQLQQHEQPGAAAVLLYVYIHIHIQFQFSHLNKSTTTFTMKPYVYTQISRENSICSEADSLIARTLFVVSS